jgi:hypothetical protein
MSHPSNSGNNQSKAVSARNTKHKQHRDAHSFFKTYKSLDPFPNRANVQFTYCQRFLTQSNTITGDCGTENSMRLNSCFDPDATGGTHQPYGYDQMTAIYNRYVVHKVEAELVIQNTSGNQAMALGFIVRPSNGSLSISGLSITDVWEKSQCDVLFPWPTGQTVRHKINVNIWDVEGMTKAQLLANVEEYSALMSANPVRIPTLAFAVANTSSNSQITIQTYVRFVYHVELFDRITLPASN